MRRDLQFSQKSHLFLFGPRQTGKSTLLRSIFSESNCLYYDLLNTETYRRLTANPELLKKEVEGFQMDTEISAVIIDEIQKIPQLLDEAHSLIESKISYRIILSGSSARKLKRSHANMLGGRALTYKLFPFSYNELKQNFDLDRALNFGTLPSVYLAENNRDRYEILRSYVNTYLKEEVELEAQIRNLSGFLRFLPISANQNGEVVNYSNIAREAGIKQHIVRSYFEILEDTLMGFFLLPYHKSVRKRMGKHPKFFFFDPGVVRSINKKLSVPLSQNSSDYGRAFEHFLITEVQKINEYFRKDWEISFYRTERGVEVDCVIETPKEQVIAIEIKSTNMPSSNHCSGLRSLKQVIPQAKLILACNLENSLKIGDVQVLPWKRVLQLLMDEN